MHLQAIFDMSCLNDPNVEKEAKTLKIGQLNAYLDEMMQRAGKTDKQAEVMRELMEVGSCCWCQ